MSRSLSAPPMTGCKYLSFLLLYIVISEPRRASGGALNEFKACNSGTPRIQGITGHRHHASLTHRRSLSTIKTNRLLRLSFSFFSVFFLGNLRRSREIIDRNLHLFGLVPALGAITITELFIFCDFCTIFGGKEFFTIFVEINTFLPVRLKTKVWFFFKFRIIKR